MPAPNSNLFKIVIAGSTKAGKSSFTKRVRNDTFSLDYKPTIGTEFFNTNELSIIDESTPIQDDNDTLAIWDTAGEQRLKALGNVFYSDADAIILMTDLSLWGDLQHSNTKTEKEKLKKEIDDICKERPTNPPHFYLVGTKYDVATKYKIQKLALENLNTFAKQLRHHKNDDTFLPESHVFVTTSKDSVDDTNSASQLKSPRRIINIIYTHLKKLKQANASTEEIAETPDTIKGSRLPLHIPSTASGIDTPSHSRIMRDIYLTPHPSPIEWPNMLLGGFFGAVIGAVIGIVIHNPVTCFLAAWRTTDWAEWNIPNIFRIFIFAPIVNPLVAMGYGAINGGATGAEWGVSKKLLDIPREMSEPFKLRTIITGSVLSVFIIVAAAVAVIHLLPVTLPILLGITGATALVAGVSYEGVDSVLTDNELKETLKNKSASKPLLRSDDGSSLRLESSSRSSSHVTSSTQQNSVMAVNAYEKAHNAGSWRSWFQVPPAASSDNSQTASDSDVTSLDAKF